MTDRLDGCVALVTGGAKGIGAAHARLFAAEGAKVVISDVLVDEGEALAKEIGELSRFIRLDVTSEDEWAETVSSTVSAFGRLDVLVNNAGVSAFCPLSLTTLDDYMRVVGVNQVGVFLGMRSVITVMADSGGGSIINISSVDGLEGGPMVCAYVASKFAVRGMTKVAALELAGLGIRVNSIHPGAVTTDMAMAMVPGLDVAKLLEPIVPMRRMAEPEEVARLGLFLASSDSSYCTGAEFVVDGGLTAGGPLPDVASLLGSL